jgi:fumarylacetoacetase
VLTLDETHAPERQSWVQTANQAGCEFPIQNLPFGMFNRIGEAPRFGIAIGDCVLDVAAAFDAGFISNGSLAVAKSDKLLSLNSILALGPDLLTDLRRQAAALLDANGRDSDKAQAKRDKLLVAQSQCEFLLPTQIGDYTDFYAGIHHAHMTGSFLRPDDPLPSNYKWTPIASHGRTSSIVVSGTDIRRPLGQLGSRGGQPPRYAPSNLLDFELELGLYIGRGNPMGSAIDIADASSHIAGYCLLNDWSARDVQRWESVPLGPFLSKSFASTLSPWIVTTDALLPFRLPVMTRDPGDPVPLPHLFDAEDQNNGGLDIELSVLLQTEKMRHDNISPLLLGASNAKYLYWSPAQMVTHQTSGGCNLRPGDLIGSGTLSGPTSSERGSLLEMSLGGKSPIALPNGETRRFLEDGDEVTFKAICRRDGFTPIGFGACVGRVLPAAG